MQTDVHSLAVTCSLLGVKHVVMSPGSRSAPLVFAFAENKKFTLHTLVDERSAAYVALGIAQQTQKPVVLFCTSGTAAANYYPAVAEAFYQQVPLLVLTADRPPELLNQQDGQMIDQRNLFGPHVRGFYQLPEAGSKKANSRQTAAVVAEALSKTNTPVKGPVHINLPFTEPLYPEKAALKADAGLEESVREWLRAHLVKQKPGEDEEQFTQLERAWIKSTKKMILVGLGAMQEKWITPLLRIQEQEDVVVLADVASNKHPFSTIPNFDKLLSSVDVKKLKHLEPDLLLSMGGPVLSKSLKNWLKQLRPEHHFRVQASPEMINTYQNLTDSLHARPVDVLERLAAIKWNASPEKKYEGDWKAIGSRLAKKTEAFLGKPAWSELHATHAILDRLPVGCNLQLANSSVVRYVSLGKKMDESWMVNSNRGTSGIDGCTSTAVGAALVNKRPTVLLTGDLAFLYDKNGLWLNELPDNLRIIVFNNNGGGIFTLIDGPTTHARFTKYFTTPALQEIELVAKLTGLSYYSCQNLTALKKTLETFLDPLHKAAILELKFSMKQNASIFQQFKKITLTDHI